VLDKNPFLIDEFKGLHLGSADFVAPIECQDVIPFPYAVECKNILFLKDGGIETRGPFLILKAFPDVPVTPPVASFTWTGPVTGGDPPVYDVQFTDTSTNSPTSWDWDFGDGSAHGTEQNPLHVYATAGPYTVVLTATNAGGSDDDTQIVDMRV
jgi:PKD repeat protein